MILLFITGFFPLELYSSVCYQVLNKVLKLKTTTFVSFHTQALHEHLQLQNDATIWHPMWGSCSRYSGGQCLEDQQEYSS